MNEESVFLIIIGLAILLVLLCLERNRLIRSQSRIVSQDLTSDKNLQKIKPSQTYFSKKHGIAGKPDEVKEEGGELIPYEIKSTIYRGRIYPGHILQLAAYCLLIEEETGKRPSHGVIEYANHREIIPYTNELRSGLLTQIKKIRQENPEENDLPPDCNVKGKCSQCGYNYYCHSGQKRLF